MVPCKKFRGNKLSKKLNVNFFWHEDDEITIFKKLDLCHPKIKYSSKMSNSIICLPEIYKKKINLYDGFCSDYIENFSIKFKECL